MFKKIKLNYGLNELEPIISKSTLENHYNKNYTFYEKELSKALKDHKLPDNLKTISDVVKNYLKLLLLHSDLL